MTGTIEREKALGGFEALTGQLTAHYGPRLIHTVLFGSRARGDAGADSDYDIAVVLLDGNWKFWDEVRTLGSIGYDILMQYGLTVHILPISQTDWADPSKNGTPPLIAAIKRDATAVPQAA
jgi:uncharacterized protein